MKVTTIFNGNARSLFLLCCTSIFQIATTDGQEASPFGHYFYQGSFCRVVEEWLQYAENSTTRERIWYLTALLEMEDWHATEETFIKWGPYIDGQTDAEVISQFRLLRARYLQKIEEIDQSEALFEMLLVETANTSNNYPELLFHFAEFQYFIESYDEAVKSYEKVLEIAPVNSAIRALAHHGAGNAYKRFSRLVDAEAAYESSKVIWEQAGLINHPAYADLLNDYCLLKVSTNRIPEAQELLHISESVNQSNCQIPSKVGYNHGANANIYYATGKYEEAMSEYRKVIQCFQSIDQNLDLAIAYNRLGGIHSLAFPDSVELTRSYFDSSLVHLQQVLRPGQNSLHKAFLLDAFGRLLEYDWKYDAADSCYQEGLAIIENMIGKENKHYSDALNNLGTFYELSEDAEKALSFYSESLAIVKRIYSKGHPDYLSTLYNMARVYVQLDKVKSASIHYKQANKRQLELLHNYYASFDEQTRLDYRLLATGNFDVFVNFAVTQNQPDLNKALQDLSMATKNLVFDYSTRFRNRQISNELSEARRKYESTRRQLSQAYNMTLGEQRNYGFSIDSLEKEQEVQEQALVRAIPNWHSERKEYLFADLAAALDPQEAAIDILAFPHHDGLYLNPDSMLYYALITKKELSAPRLIYLTNSSKLAEILENYEHYTKDLEASEVLYHEIWEPIEKEIAGIRKINLSADGKLFQIAFEGICKDASDSGDLLFNDFEIRYHNNLRDLLQDESENQYPTSAVLLGDPTFDVDSTNFIRWQNSLPTLTGQTIQTLGPFDRLPGTSQEIRLLNDLLQEHHYQTKVFSGQRALENQIASYYADPSPAILHIATHGYFYQYDEWASTEARVLEERFSASKNALLRSGLILAGGNYTWNGGTVPPKFKDGVLTSREVIDLNLKQTKLVVLSACDTGRGKETDGEGVFGLQRAFRLAGARQLVMSLWKVIDREAAEFMKYFYQSYLETNQADFALRKAKKAMKEKGYSPYSWAGFVLYN